MIYLIGQLALWLFLTAAFAAFAGWAYAAQRAAPGEAKLRRDRDALLRDLSRLASGEAPESDGIEAERELDALRRQLEVRSGRIAELEAQLEQARSRADNAAGDLAHQQRRIEGDRADTAELDRLRALVAAHDADRAREVEVIAAPVEPSEDDGLQAWRLRYFEQRVRYLEGLAAKATAAPEQAVSALPTEPPLDTWRAREAEARAAHLEQQLRTLSAPAAANEAAPFEEPPFAADAEIDVLLRWRLLYLERRVAHLQTATAEPMPLAVRAPDAGQDSDRWKWRARYLEARVRHLEQRPLQVQTLAVPAGEQGEDAAPAPSANVATKKPPVLTSARNGAPDDFTLIESVSPLQQTTLNAIGIFHFDQIAAWTPENVAWIDRYFRLRGRVTEEEWVEQAADLARDGVSAARRVLEGEEA